MTSATGDQVWNLMERICQHESALDFDLKPTYRRVSWRGRFYVGFVVLVWLASVVAAWLGLRAPRT